MFSLNEVKLIGTVGKEPETNNAGDSKVTNISLATSTGGYTNKEGKEIPERTQWHNVKVWNNKWLEGVLHKGSRLFVAGTIEYHTYEKDGQKRIATEIVADRVMVLDKTEKKEDGSKPF